MNNNLLKTFAIVTILALVVTALPMPRARALSPDIVISQVYGGGGNSGATYTNDFIELFNRGTSTVSLAGWSVQYASATGSGLFGGSTTQITPLSGTLAPGQYLLIQERQGSGGTTPLPTPDVTDSSPIAMSASGGKVALVMSDASLGCNGGSTPCDAEQLVLIKDLVGWDGANFYETDPAPGTSNTTALLRLAEGCTESDDNSADFATGAPTPRNTASPLNPCAAAEVAPTVVSTFPADGATDFPIAADLTVTFSEPVEVTASWFQLACSVSGPGGVATTFSGGPTTFTLDPDVSLADGETCTLTVFADQVSDQDAYDPPDHMDANLTVSFTPFDVCAVSYTPIYAIQGDGPAAAITGPVTTQGVVVGDYEGPSPALRGFYIQDAAGDGEANTSDGIFVYNGSNDNVNLGDVVRVTGNASEYQDQTQIGSVSAIARCGSGTITPEDVTMPFPSATYLEQFEGMLVRFPQTLYVTEHYQLGRFGQVLLSSGGRLQQPTSVVGPGAPALALQAENDLNKIILDDNLQNQNPDPILFGRGGLPLSASNTLRGGDTATGIVGMMTYTWAGNAASGNAYRLRPVNALGGGVPDFQPTNPRPTSVPDVGGSAKVVGMNLLNFFNTFSGCTNGVGGTPTECRGASDADEFERQYDKTVAAILEMDPDVLGVNEIENDGYGADSALQFLVDQLNEKTAPGTYAFIDVDGATGQTNALGTDAIKVALLYQPGVVTPVGQTAALNSVAFVNGGDTAPRSRPSLAQAFEVNATGARFVVDVNHLKSKGSACDAPDEGDGQGNCNTVRANAATELVNWLATDPTATGDPDILLIGDYNSYAMEDPIKVIENAGFTNLISSFLGAGAYSYVFDGQWGYLDHALGSPSIVSQTTGVADYHINADEPSVLDYLEDFKSTGQLISLYAPDQYRVSDHDPVIVGLDLINYPPELGDITLTPNVAAIGAPISASAIFTDPDPVDIHTALVDWGDGSASTGTVTEADGTGTISGSHAYAAPGIYAVTVTVDDGYGNTDTAVYEFAVVYDPDAGFVTGGGWIDSPMNEDYPYMQAAGKAIFGFVAKYQKGAKVPVGNAEFQFKAGDLNFKSTSYEWLVVAGSKAQFKGEGTINGEGAYKFMLSADDGDPDTFRIKIWYEDEAGEHILYDNGSQQAIGEGSIVVHK